MRNIFLVGYYGYKNIGDDLLLYEISQSFKAKKKYNISALSFDAKKTSMIYGIQGVSRLKGLSLVRHIKSVDIVVYGGGSILQDATSSKSLYYYIGIMLLAKMFGKKVYLLGNGYGPIKSGFNKKILDLILSRVDGVIARDEKAYEEFKNHKVKKLYKGVDCGFLATVGDEKDNSLAEILTKSRPYVIVSIRDWKSVGEFISQLKSTVASLVDSGYDIYFLAMKLPEDDRIMRENFMETDNVHYMSRDIVHIKQYFQNSKFTIGIRFHSLVFSILSNKPFIAVPYDPKVVSLATQSEQILLNNMQDIRENELQEAVDDMLENYDTYEKKVKRKNKQYREEAKEQFDVFFKWIEEYK